MTETRKLAAVMFTDIVGYTALMSRDEQKADRDPTELATKKKKSVFRFALWIISGIIGIAGLMFTNVLCFSRRTRGD